MIPTCLALLSFLSTAMVAPPDFRAYAGNYHVGPDEVIAIAEWELDPGSPHVLAFTNLKPGRIGVLSELAADEFALHEGLLAGPQVVSIHFIRSRDSDIALIYAPASGPFPVIVIVPAGAVGRRASATFPNFFLAEGFGVLVYDRRPGSAPFTTYAADAVAARVEK